MKKTSCRIKKYIIIVLTTLLMLSIVSCNSTNTIKIGFLGTVTGPTGDLALSGKHGAELAIEEINALGGINGRKIELVVKNSLNDSEITKQLVNEFANDNINIVIGEFTSNLTKAALEAQDANKILFLSPTTAADSFVGIDDNLIRFIGSTSLQAETIISQALPNNDKSFLIIKNADNLEFVNPLAESFKENLLQSGGTVVSEEYLSSSQISRIPSILEKYFPANHKTDGILLLSDALSTIQFIQKIREAKLDVNIYTPLWANTTDLYTLGSTYNEGIYTLGFYAPSDNPKYETFNENYTQLFGSAPVPPSYFTYDTVMSLYYALLDTGKSNHRTIKEAILNSTVNGITSDFYIDEYGDASRQYAPFIINNGKMTPLNPAD